MLFIAGESNPLPTSPCIREGRREAPAQRVAIGVAGEQAVVRAARVVDHQPVRVRVAHQVVEVDAVGPEQFMHQGEGEQAVGAGTDADPFVGDRAVAGAHRVDRDDLGATRLQLA